MYIKRSWITMDKNTIIISMTSYPARIKHVALVWFSILRQMKPEYNCHCVLVLSKEEFPNLTKDLPSDLNALVNHNKIELLWVPRDLRSHKKLMPTLAAYPDNPILIIDDDQLRPDGWLRIFVEDHKKFPNDVLAGRIQQREINGSFEWKPITDSERGCIIKYGRSQNGRGGTLYPPHLFTDPEFFDENLYMKYSNTSDESWQYYWMRKHGIWPRATTSYIKDEDYVIKEAQNKLALWEVNRNKYNGILAKLISVFG